jgi:hypothetical protein
MEEHAIDYLENLDKIPAFRDKVISLRDKYGYPLKVQYLSLSDNDGLYMTHEFYCEFVKLTDVMIEYLMKEFPSESSDTSIFPKSKYCTDSKGNPETGIKVWVFDHIRRDKSEPGNFRSDYMFVKGRAIYDAYLMCIDGKKQRFARETKEIERLEKIIADRKIKLEKSSKDEDPH